MNKNEAVAPVLATVLILIAASIISIEARQTPVLAINAAEMMTDSNIEHIMKGQIANVQLGNDSKPAWIESGIWVLRVSSSSNLGHPAAFLVVKMQMVKPDGTAKHSHNIFNYQLNNTRQEGNTTIFNGTATVTMKDTPVTGVPLTIKIFNNAVIGLWIGPNRIDGHFGTSPVYGTVVIASKAPAASNMIGQGISTSNQTNVIKMTAKEVNEIYRWSTSEGINADLKMVSNSNNVIQINNPTDTKHELVIESNAKEVASSGDIMPGNSSQLTFKPTTVGTFKYHCEYHPTTMNGTIVVTAPS